MFAGVGQPLWVMCKLSGPIEEQGRLPLHRWKGGTRDHQKLSQATGSMGRYMVKESLIPLVDFLKQKPPALSTPECQCRYKRSHPVSIQPWAGSVYHLIIFILPERSYD